MNGPFLWSLFLCHFGGNLLCYLQESNRRASKKAVKIEEKLELKKTEASLRKALAEKQAKCDELRDYYDRKSEEQIESLTKAMDSTVQSDVMFLFRWKIV